MVETKYEGLGVHINVKPSWLASDKHVDSFYGKIPIKEQTALKDFASIDSLVRNHNQEHDDSLNMFYWDTEGNIILGYILNKDEGYVPQQKIIIQADNKVIPANNIQKIRMVRIFSDHSKQLQIISSPHYVLHMLNCFDEKVEENLSTYLKNLPLEDQLDQFRRYFGRKAENPILELYYKVGEKKLKSFKRRTHETIRYKDILSF